jgi:cytochrome c peroxidase
MKARCAAAVAAALWLCGAGASSAGDREPWTAAERASLRTMQLSQLAPRPADPSNRVEALPAAAALGKRLFFDPRFSANGQVSCASCHVPERQFQDGLPVGQGVATGVRRTMPVVASGHGAWQFWDGRKDSVWAQALGPLEDANEHGGNRLAYAKLLARHYRAEYEALFQAMPPLDGLPGKAGPAGTPAERSAWAALSETQRRDVSRIFANMGKALAAYESTLHYGPSRLDRYIGATLQDAPQAGTMLTPSEKNGLRLFIGKGACITCHGGPLLTDQHFHNTGVPPRDPAHPDRGRAAAIAQVRADPFNCLGPFSDAKSGACGELEFIADDDPHMLGAFKTPGLRNVALRPPYMHAGQFATLEEVVRHYANAPRAAIGKSERQPVAFTERELGDLVNFLGTLSGPIVEAPR